MFQAVEEFYRWGRDCAAEALDRGVEPVRTGFALHGEMRLFTPYIEAAIAALEDSHRDPALKDKVTVSGMYGLCVRRRALDELFPERKETSIPWWLRLTFDFGHSIHHLFQQRYLPAAFPPGSAIDFIGEWSCRCGKFQLPLGVGADARCLECRGWLKYVEHRTRWEDHDTSGGMDMLFSVQLPGIATKWIGDAKSIDGNAFKNMKGPLVDNVYQLQIYLNLMGVDDGVLFYVSKGTSEAMIREFHVRRDPWYQRDADRKLKALKEWRGLEGSKIPYRECETPKDKRAKRCDQCVACFDPVVLARRMEHKGFEVDAVGVVRGRV